MTCLQDIIQALKILLSVIVLPEKACRPAGRASPKVSQGNIKELSIQSHRLFQVKCRAECVKKSKLSNQREFFDFSFQSCI